MKGEYDIFVSVRKPKYKPTTHKELCAIEKAIIKDKDKQTWRDVIIFINQRVSY